MSSTKILVVDDDSRIRALIRSFLSSRPGWIVCGEAEDGVDSIKQAKAKRPDVVLMDVSMPRMNGLDATRALRREIPDVSVILVSQNDPRVLSRQASDVGARGYCTKSDLTRNLGPVIEKAMEPWPSSKQNNMTSSELERISRSQTSNLLAAIVDSSDDAIISKNLDGMITSWNHSAERIFGYRADEAIGKHITLIIPRDRWEEETNILRRLRAGERVDHFETVRKRKDGELLNLSLTISPVRDSSGRVIGASKVARDITAQIRAAEALRESEERFRKLSETLDAEVRVRTRELEELSWQLFRTQDEERRHIARELHECRPDSHGAGFELISARLESRASLARASSGSRGHPADRSAAPPRNSHHFISSASALAR